MYINFTLNKDENVHRFALSALRGNSWRERERDKEIKITLS